MKKFIALLSFLTLTNAAFAVELRCKESKNDRPIRAQAKKINLNEFGLQDRLRVRTFSYQVNNFLENSEPSDKLQVQVVVIKQLPTNEIKITSVSIQTSGSPTVKAEARVFEGTRILGTELTLANQKVAIECSLIKARSESL
jgi:hypothetical protein